jgi:hypothetical protein
MAGEPFTSRGGNVWPQTDTCTRRCTDVIAAFQRNVLASGRSDIRERQAAIKSPRFPRFPPSFWHPSCYCSLKGARLCVV